MSDLLILPDGRRMHLTQVAYFRLRKPLPLDVSRSFLQFPSWRRWALANRFLVSTDSTQRQLPAPQEEPAHE